MVSNSVEKYDTKLIDSFKNAIDFIKRKTHQSSIEQCIAKLDGQEFDELKSYELDLILTHLDLNELISVFTDISKDNFRVNKILTLIDSTQSTYARSVHYEKVKSVFKSLYDAGKNEGLARHYLAQIVEKIIKKDS